MRVCFRLNISPTADEMGQDCTFQIFGSLGNCSVGSAWSLCLLLVACCPPLRPLGLAASLDENPACGPGCWQRPTTTLLLPRAPDSPVPSLDLTSADVNLGPGNSTSTVRTGVSAEGQPVLQPRGRTTAWAPWRSARVLRGRSTKLLPHKRWAMGLQGRVRPACQGPGAVRTCVLSWSSGEPWTLGRAVPGAEMYPRKGGGGEQRTADWMSRRVRTRRPGRELE